MSRPRRFLLGLRYEAVWFLVFLGLALPWGLLWGSIASLLLTLAPASRQFVDRWPVVYYTGFLAITLIPVLFVHHRIMRRLRPGLLPKKTREG